MSVCLHIDGEGRLGKHKLPYRAHIRVHGSGIDETVDSVYIEYDHEALPQAADRALHNMSDERERVLTRSVREEALAAYMMKRVRDEDVEIHASV